jgi:regulator of protease activity HflC (stomatin/prohibitin superfamily)
MEYWTSPGFKWQWFGKTTHYYKTNQVWFNNITTTDKGELTTYGLENPAFPITYADKGKGFVLGSVRIELPKTETHLNLIQEHYGSEERLMEELIKPTIGKVILACGPLMTSLESVAEKRNDLIAYATDQLNNGIYATTTRTVERLNSITNELEKIQQAEIIYDEESNPKRNEESPFVKYGLKVSQLAIADLKYETATNNQIARQREADMDIISAKAEAAKAIQQTIKIEEEGKQRAAEAKWKQEAIKAAEVTKAEQAYEVARLQALEAKELAKKIKEQGEAEAHAARLKVQAGLTPLEKATIEKETAIGVAQALANIKLPTYVVAGGNGNSNTAMDAMGLKMMTDLVNQMSK